MIDLAELEGSLIEHLPRQRWFGLRRSDIAAATVEVYEVMQEQWPALISLEVQVRSQDGSTHRYHVPIGLRPLGEKAVFLEGKAHSVLGEFRSDRGGVFAYDAVVDPALARRLASEVVPALGSFEIVRPMGVQQSNSSLVYDERVVLKLFRQITEPSLDLEMTSALWKAGFRQIAQSIGVWAREGRDLAMAQRYLSGGVEAWALARTSLRDLFGSGNEPETAGGDFAGDCRRIGDTTAKMHQTLANAFGFGPADPRDWVTLMNASLERVSDPRIDVDAARTVFDSLAGLADVGASMRIHGDYHLGQLVETDDGWFVLDFEGEPARLAEERRAPSSPLRDVAGMLRSIEYAARVVESEQENSHGSQADSWIRRNREAFLDGYSDANGGLDLLPSDRGSFERILRAFELDKAIYEVGYEQAHRPDWVEIPLRAVESMLA